MPTILNEDDKSAVIQRDDGSTFKLAKTPENERRILAPLRPNDKPIMERIFGDGSSRLAEKPVASGTEDLEAATEAPVSSQPAPQGNVFQRNSEIIQSGEFPSAPPSPQGQPAPVSAPSGESTPQSQQPGGVAETGLGMIGQGFETSQKALKEQQDALMEGAKVGAKAAGQQLGAIRSYEQAMVAENQAAIIDANTRNKLLDQKMAEVDEAKKAYMEQGAINPNRLWENKSGWQKAVAGLSILLGSVSTDPNHVNQGMKAINEAIERDIKAQENRQDQLKNSVTMEQQGFENMRQAFHDKTQNYLFKKSMYLDSLKLQTDKIALQNQGSELAARAKALSAQLADASGQLMRQYGELFVSSIPSVKDVKPEQWKAANFAARAQQAEQEFSGWEKKGFNGATYLQAAGKALPSGAQAEGIKGIEQAQTNFVMAILRPESGAVISPSEIKTAIKQYFPQAGDTPKNLEQKRRNRQQAILGLQAQAGPAMRLMPVVQATPVAPTFTPVSSKR